MEHVQGFFVDHGSEKWHGNVDAVEQNDTEYSKNPDIVVADIVGGIAVFKTKGLGKGEGFFAILRKMKQEGKDNQGFQKKDLLWVVASVNLFGTPD